MAETVKINLDVESRSLSSLLNDVDKLRTELNKATDPSDINRLNDEFTKTTQKIKDIEKATKGLSLDSKFEDVYGDIQPLNGRLGELEDRMYELAFAGKANTEEFKALQAEASNMRKTIIDVDRQVDLMAENKGLGVFGAGISNLGDSLMRLDFDTAVKDAQGLAMASKNMSFGKAAKSLKQLGSVFGSLGKALLTNPIFLIAGVIAAIIAIVVKLMDELGLLEIIMDGVGKVFEWIMTPIDALIQGLKDLTDWFGWTSHAAEEAAERQAKAAKKAADAQERRSNRAVLALDNEIRKMKANGEVTDEEFEKILAAEAEKRNQLMLTAKARLDEAQAAVKSALIKGDLSEEEIQDLKDKQEEAVLAYKAARDNVEIGDIEANTRRKERQEKATQKEKSELDKRQKAWKDYQRNRLNAERQIQDLTLELMGEGSEKELAENKTKYDRLIEDTRASETLTEEEKTRIIEQYENLRQQKIDEINEKTREEEKKKELDFQNTLQQMKLNNMKEGAEKEKTQINSNYESERESILTNEELTENQKTQLLKQLKIKRDAELKAVDDQLKAEAKAEEQLLRELEIQNMEEGLNKELALIEDKYAKELESAKGNAELIKQIEIAKEKEITKAKEDAAKAEKEIRKSQMNGALDATSAILSATIQAAGEGTAVAKAAGVAQATIDTYKAAQGAYASLAGIPVVGPGLGAAAAAAAIVSGIMNVKSILSTPTPGGGGGAGGGSVPSRGNIPQQPRQTPGVSLFGSANEGSEGSSSMFESQENNKPQQVKAVVSWSDIDAVSNDDSSIQDEMQL